MPPPALADRFQLVGELGRGGMGAVSLVFDAQRGERVALKRMHARGAEFAIRFKREYRVLEAIRHPNLIRLYELGEDADGLYFTMEAIHGVDLLDAYRGVKAPAFATTEIRLMPRSPETPATEKISAMRSVETRTLEPPQGSGEDAADERARDPAAVIAAPSLDHAKLVALGLQLADALAHLHDHGVIHRDLKPSNVLVRDDGAVKLLDFGILAELPAPGSSASGRGELDAGRVLGTPGFMAPEQIAGEPSGPAADIYAFGVLLYLLVAGRLPFTADSRGLLRSLKETPPRLSTLAPEVPASLDDLVHAMLARAPAARPDARAVKRALGGDGKAGAAPSEAPPGPRRALVGREELRARVESLLDSALAGELRGVVLRGATGVGKTALAEQVATAAAARGVIVLRGRGRPDEGIPYNAVDGVMDELTLALRGPLAERVGPLLRATAALAFPVLADPSAPPLRGPVARGDIFSAVARLFGQVAASAAGLVVFVDDLQWADIDSVALLGALMDERPAGLALLATTRDDVGRTPGGSLGDHRPRVVTLAVPPLDGGALAAIMQAIVTRAGGAPDLASIEGMVQVASGRPFMAELLGRFVAAHGAVGLFEPTQAIGMLLARAGELGRRVVLLLIAEDGWLTLQELAALAGATVGAVQETLRDLERDGLARQAGADGPAARAAMYHDAVAAALAPALGPELARAHAALAAALASRPESSPHRLVHHLVAAGTPVLAVPHARVAAARAAAQGAFGLAADMYAVLLAHSGDERLPLLRARGDALVRSGRYSEAADVWSEVASRVEGDDAVEARMHQAHALLGAGEVALGRRVLDAASAGATYHARFGALDLVVTVARFLLGPSAPVAVTPLSRQLPPAGVARRLEVDVRLANMLGYFEPVSGLGQLRRARDRADRAGARELAAWVDYLFAYIASFSSATRSKASLGARYRSAADARLGGRVADHPITRSFPTFLDMVDAQREGRFEAGREPGEVSLALFESAGLIGCFEHLFGFVHRVQLDFYAEDVPAFGASLARMRAAVRDSGESAMHCHLAMLESQHAAFTGDFASSALSIANAFRHLPRDVWTFQRVLMNLYAPSAIYATDCREARRTALEALRLGRFQRIMSTMYAGHIAGSLALLEAGALRGGDREASPRRVARWAAVCRRAPPLAATAGLRAQAYAEDARRRPAHAVALLLAAENEALRWNQRISAAIASFQRGRRIGGDGGAALEASARQLLGEAGASELILHEDPAHR